MEPVTTGPDDRALAWMVSTSSGAMTSLAGAATASFLSPLPGNLSQAERLASSVTKIKRRRSMGNPPGESNLAGIMASATDTCAYRGIPLRPMTAACDELRISQSRLSHPGRHSCHPGLDPGSSATPPLDCGSWPATTKERAGLRVLVRNDKSVVIPDYAVIPDYVVIPDVIRDPVPRPRWP